MIEALAGFAFLIALWAFGRSLILASSAIDCDWLAMPIGLCLVGLISNVLYFGAGLTVQTIQLLFLVALFACLVAIFRRGVQRDEWGRLLAVCGIFFILALPAYIGGEQYYVFRGNHWDQFNYINQTLTLRDNAYSVYRNASAGDFLDKDVLVHGLQFLHARPAVGLVFSLLLPAGRGNIHLLSFLYVTALSALAFPALYFAWKRILEAYDMRASGLLMSIVPPFAFVVGFWGQYVFDINAWSQSASMPLQLALVFVYMRLLQKLAELPVRGIHSLKSDFFVTGLLAAGGFLFYPENAVLQALPLLIATIWWCEVTGNPLRSKAVASLAIFSVAVLLISSLPNWNATVGFVIGQVKSGATHFPTWWMYFDSYWKGIHGNGAVGHISPLANLILASIGMYFVTPDYAAPVLLRYGWIVVAVVLATLAIYSLAVSLFRRFKMNQTTVFLKAFFLFGVLILLYFFESGALWSLGKLLSYLAPYLFLIVCLGLVETAKKPEIVSASSNAAGDRMIRRFVIIFIASQIAFGAARLWTARDAHGIGYDNATYPSIQVPSMKTAYLWDMEPTSYAGCKGVNLQQNVDPFYMEYMKQKLAYTGIPYFSSSPVTTHYAGGSEVGRQPAIITDCNAEVMKTSTGHWHAVHSRPPR